MQHDAIVIGGSYAGLSAAIYIARARRSVCVIDAGEPRNRFAEASHGFFGQDGAEPRAMIAAARAKLAAYPTVTFIDGRVMAVQGADGDFTATLASGEVVRSAKLVLAFGVADQLSSLSGLRERWGRTVLHCPYCHGYEFGGRRLGVLATAAKSSHQALLIPEWGPTTFFLNGREDLDAETLSKLASRGVTVEPAPVLALEGEAPRLSGVRLADGRLVPLDALFVAFPTRPASDLAEQLGCAYDEGHFGPVIRTDAMRMTTVPGVYAAGDVAREPHSATFASADGVQAGASLHQALAFGALAA